MQARNEAVGRLRQRLQRFHWPRVSMAVVVMLTGLAGLIASAQLLDAGMHVLWQRYALSVIAAYLVFLVLLRICVWMYRHRIDPNIDSGGGGSGSGNSGSVRVEDTLDFDVPDADEAGVVILVAVAVVALIGAALACAFWTVWIAPTLLAELLFDVALASGLYRRLRGIEDSGSWLKTAMRRTLKPFAVLLLLSMAVGWGIQQYEPGVVALGDLFD